MRPARLGTVFISRALAAQLPVLCRRPAPSGHPSSVLQAGGSSRPTGGLVLVTAQLVIKIRVRLGVRDLDELEETSFVEFDVGYDDNPRPRIRLAARARPCLPLRFLRGLPLCRALLSGTSGSRVRLDLTMDRPISPPATRLFPTDARALLGPLVSVRPPSSAVHPIVSVLLVARLRFTVCGAYSRNS